MIPLLNRNPSVLCKPCTRGAVPAGLQGIPQTSHNPSRRTGSSWPARIRRCWVKGAKTPPAAARSFQRLRTQPKEYRLSAEGLKWPPEASTDRRSPQVGAVDDPGWASQNSDCDPRQLPSHDGGMTTSVVFLEVNAKLRQKREAYVSWKTSTVALQKGWHWQWLIYEGVGRVFFNRPNFYVTKIRCFLNLLKKKSFFFKKNLRLWVNVWLIAHN